MHSSLPKSLYSDRGSHYASGIHQELLAAHDLVGSMSQRGNPDDNAKAESFIEALKIEAVYLMAFGTFNDIAEQLPRFIDDVCNQSRLHSALSYISPVQFEEQHTRPMVRPAGCFCPKPGAHSIAGSGSDAPRADR